MALREEEEHVATTLEVIWEKRDGEYAAWEVEHLFGYELCFGRVTGGLYLPVRWTPLAQQMTPFEHRQAVRALFCWTGGDWSAIVSLLADLAAGG